MSARSCCSPRWLLAAAEYPEGQVGRVQREPTVREGLAAERSAARIRQDVTILLEAAVESLDDALAAVDGGADRLELCANLDEGGTTPDPTLIAAVSARVAVPVFAM